MQEKWNASIKPSRNSFQKYVQKTKRPESSFTILLVFYNASKSATTGYTPFYLTQGIPCLFHFDTTLQVKSNEPFVQDLETHMEKIFILAEQIFMKAQITQQLITTRIGKHRLMVLETKFYYSVYSQDQENQKVTIFSWPLQNLGKIV